MIVDITNEIYTVLKQALTGVTVLEAYPSTVPTFPCIVVEEMQNLSDEETKDSSGFHYSRIALEINIFSNAENKISQVKNIRKQINDILNGNYKMNRDDARPVPNYADDNIYRYVLRYSAMVDSSRTIYRG